MTPIQPTAGYSKRSLVDKLGIKAGQRIALLNAPADYGALLGPLPPGVKQDSTTILSTAPTFPEDLHVNPLHSR